MTSDRRAHWDNIYSTKREAEVSWFQERPEPSPELLAFVGAGPTSAIVDIGGGASQLVDSLLDQGFEQITVMDLSAEALGVARKRLGEKAAKVKWIVADATTWEPPQLYDVWHDRATFHFLTSEREQQAYLDRLKRGLRLGGHVIIGAFAPDGPQRCSGLPVARYSAESLATLLGRAFTLVDSRRHEHVTPWGAAQRFQFGAFRRIT